MVHHDGFHMSTSNPATIKPKTPPGKLNPNPPASTSNSPMAKKDKKPDLSSQSARGRRNDSSLGGEGTGHVTALWIVCKKKIVADKSMIGVEKMLGNLPDLIGMTADKLKMTLMTAVLQKSPGDIEQYSNVLGQLARARLAVLENKSDTTVDADAVVPRFIYSLINAVVLLHPSGVALGGVDRKTQIETELGYLSNILKHSYGLAGLVESAAMGQLSKAEKKGEKQSGSARRGSAPTIFVRDADLGEKEKSGRSPEGKTSEKRRNEKHPSHPHKDGDGSVRSGDKLHGHEKSKKDKVKRVRSEDSDMGAPPPNYVVPSPSPASHPPLLARLVMLPLPASPSSAPPPYSPRENAYESSPAFRASTATSTASSAITTSTAVTPTPTDRSQQVLADSSPPVSPRPTTLGSARHSMKIENLDQFMEKHIARFVRDIGEGGSALMLRVVKKLPADYELNASNPDALAGHAGDAIDSASLSAGEIKELAGLHPKVYTNNTKANQLSLMHLLIVDVAKGKLVAEGDLIPVGSSLSQERVNSLMSSLIPNLEKLDLDEVLNANLNQSDDVFTVSWSTSSSELRGPQSGSNLTSSSAAAVPPSPSSALTSREPVANYRKGTSVPPSPRSVSRQTSGENTANPNATSGGKSESTRPPESQRSSAPVSRESSGSDLEDSSGGTSDEKNAPPQSQRPRTKSQLSLGQQSAPRRLNTHNRTNTAGSLKTPSISPEKAIPDKASEACPPGKKQ
jgi:hypothetical protein